MDLNTLTAISPVDGRYRDKVEGLMNYFSEYALIKYRVLTEVEYFLALCELPLSQLAGISHKQKKELQKLYLNFTPEDAKRVKEIERI